MRRSCFFVTRVSCAEQAQSVIRHRYRGSNPTAMEWHYRTHGGVWENWVVTRELAREMAKQSVN